MQVSNDEAIAIVDIWLGTEFEGGRHLARINKIEPCGDAQGMR